MRSDFYHRCAELPELAALKEGAGQFDLLPPSFDEIGQIITYPAQVAGLRFEHDPATGRRLDAVLHEAAGQTPESLPLLSFVLDELYRERTDSGVLTFAAYEALGGMEGAIARRAESIFASQPPEARDELRPLIRGLATVEGDGVVVVARRVPVGQIAAKPGRRAMLDAMVAARLLVADRAEDGTPVVRVAHEALLDRWPRVAAWLEDDREFLRVRARVAEGAARWREEARRPDLLLPPGKPLAEAEALVTDRAEELDPGAVEYVAASSSAQRRRRRTQALVAVLIATGVTAAALVSYKEWDDGRKAKVFAENDQKAAALETALGRELQAKNRELNASNERKEKSLSFTTFFNTGNFALTGRRYQQAYDAFQKAIAIAEPLAAEPGEEQADRAKKLIESLERFATAQVGLGRPDDGKRTLERRSAFINGLPEPVRRTLKVRPNEDAGVIMLGEYGPVVVRLQLELLNANGHLKALLHQNELLKQALRERFRRLRAAGAPKAAAAKAAPAPKAASGVEKKESIDYMLGVIALGELLVTSIGDASDRNLVDSAYRAFADDMAMGDPAEAQKLVQRRLDFNLRELQRLTERVRKRNATPWSSSYGTDALHEDIADIWLSIFAAHSQAGDIHAAKGDTAAALADYTRAIETIEKAALTPRKRDDAATKVADVRFRAAELMRAKHEDGGAARELHVAVDLLVSDGEAAVRTARRRQVERYVEAAEQQANLGERDAGRASYRKALDLMARLLDESREPVDRSKLLALYSGHADFLAGQGDLPAARAAFETALADLRKRADASGDPDDRAAVASLHGSFASFLKSRKDPARAAEQHVKSVEAYRALAGPGGRRELHAALDDHYRSWVSLLEGQKDPALSRVVAERVRSLNDWRDALAKAADSAAVADEWRKLAADLTDAGDRTSAVHAHEQAVRVGERLAGTSPDPEGRNAVAASYFNLGETCLELSDVKAADAAMARARDLGEKTGYAGFQPGMSLMVPAESARVKLLLGDKPAALGLARRALAAPALEEDPATLKTSGALIAAAYRLGDKPAALGLARRALAAQRARGRPRDLEDVQRADRLGVPRAGQRAGPPRREGRRARRLRPSRDDGAEVPRRQQGEQ